MKDAMERLVLVDGHAMLYRAFFAYPMSLTTREGELINAVYGFTSILLNVIRELKPTHIAVSFDVGKTWRHEAFKEYKAHREKMPDELRMQEERVFQVVSALNIPIKVKEGFEADDVIGTLARKVSELGRDPSTAKRHTDALSAQDDSVDLASLSTESSKQKVETIIVTGDMDILQLVCDEGEECGAIRVHKPGGGRSESLMFDEAGVMQKYGLTPRQIIDFKSLAGDSSDNIPGVKGIGPKTATQLLQAFDSVERVYEHLNSGHPVLKPAVLKKLLEGRESAMESKKLVTIITDVPLSFELSDALVKTYDKDRVISLFEELEFRSLIGKLPQDEFEEAVQEALF